MKILVAHNTYRESGGEDVVVDREVSLLRSYGHDVTEYFRSNAELDRMSPGERAMVPVTSIWSRKSRHLIADVIRRKKPAVVHFHNMDFVISRAAYYACRELGVPIVQSLHNPRLMCPAATFVYKGELCERCSNRSVAWPGVIRGCYRQSHFQTSVVAASTAFHKALGTHHLVNRYFASTETYRMKFIAAGLPPERVLVNPHFVTPDPAARSDSQGDYALYIGRLEKPKGVETLVQAWSKYLTDIPLVIRGSGPLRSLVEEKLVRPGYATLVAQMLTTEELYKLIKGARFLIWPSHGLYETFGLVVAEAFACGVPVIASDAGVAKEMVADGRTGLHFRAADAHDLSTKVRWAWGERGWVDTAGRAARAEFEQRFTSERSYQVLMNVYEEIQSGSDGTALAP